MALDVGDPMAGVELVPSSVEVLRDLSKLDDQFSRKIHGGGLASLFFPEPGKGLLVLAHDDTGVGTADKVAPIEI
jgi:hypothetical protein